MALLGFVRKEVAKKVRRREGKLQNAKRDKVFARSLRNQSNLGFRVRISGKPWNSERASNKPIEVVRSGPMSAVIAFAALEFVEQNTKDPLPTSSMVTVEVILPNQTRVAVPEKYWKKYLKAY